MTLKYLKQHYDNAKRLKVVCDECFRSYLLLNIDHPFDRDQVELYCTPIRGRPKIFCKAHLKRNMKVCNDSFIR
jgi:hypothetical protein